MKLIKLFPIIFFVFFCFTSNAQTKDWTLLIYVVGSDIVQDAITDIEEMKAAGNTDNINIVGLLGGSSLISSWENPAASSFVNGVEIPVNFTPTESSMISTKTLSEFIDWGVDNYPAEKYMLMFYNHGMAIRGFGHDNTIDDQFKLNDLQDGIEQSSFFQNGNKFEVLGFDACLMACLEAQSVMQNTAKYFVASEEEEPWHAWSWTPIIEAMNTQADLEGEELGKIIIDNYIQHAIDNESKNVTLSIVDLSKTADLVNAVDDLFKELDDEIYLANFTKARAESEEYGKAIKDPEISEDMVDIGDLVKHLKSLEPGLTSQIDEVLAKLDSTVVYERSDLGKPKATGISMYVPMNVFVDEEELNGRLDEEYKPINFNQSIKDFIIDEYVDFAISDDAPNTGTLDDNTFGFVSSGSVLGDKYTAIKIPASEEDLHQIQVILIEEITGTPNEFLMLGSAIPDTSTVLMDGSTVYGYEWDEEWIGINGIPAYIADIQEFEVFDDNGVLDYSFTRLHIPAILNPNTAEETEIVLSYAYTGNLDYELEEVRGEHYGDNVIIPSKENIELKSGDKIQLVYEIFDAVTQEAVFSPGADAIIDIETGNDDLVLEHDQLEPGRYHVGFVLMDHAHNDTIIYDTRIREVLMTSNTDLILPNDNTLLVYPNPVNENIHLNFEKPIDAQIMLYNTFGQELYNARVSNETQYNIDLSKLPAASYIVKVFSEGKSIEKLIVKE